MKEVIKILNNIEKYYWLPERYTLDCSRAKWSKSIWEWFQILWHPIDELNNQLFSIPAQWVYKDSNGNIYNFPWHSYDTVMSILDERKEKLRIWDGMPSVIWVDDKWNIVRISAMKVHDNYETYKREEDIRLKKKIALEVLNTMTSQNRNKESKEFKELVIKLFKLEFFKNIYNKWYSEYIVIWDEIHMDWLNPIKIISHELFKKVYKLMVKWDIEWIRDWIKKEAWESSISSVSISNELKERINLYREYINTSMDRYNSWKSFNIDIEQYMRVYNSISNELWHDNITYMVLWSDWVYDMLIWSRHIRNIAWSLCVRIDSLLEELIWSFRYDHGKFHYYINWSKKQHWIYLHKNWSNILLKSNWNIVYIDDYLELSNEQYIKRMKWALLKEIDSLETWKQQLINRIASIMKWWNWEELDKIMKQIEIILELDCVNDIRYNDNNIYVHTNPIYINKYYDDIQYDYDTLIWEFIITIWIWSSTVLVNRKHQSWIVHPHVWIWWSFCVWDFWRTMYNAAQNYDYVTCVLYTIEHITTYNRQSPYVRLWNYIQRNHAHITEVSNNKWVPLRRPLTWFSKCIDWSDFQLVPTSNWWLVTNNWQTLSIDTTLTFTDEIF